MRRLPIALSVLLAAVVVLGAACGATGDGADDEVSGTMGAGTTVDIVEFAFAPDEVTVSVGDTVTWTNRDSVAHTATGSVPGTISSGDLQIDDSYDVTFEEAGSFEYLCAYHPFMTGTITVEG